MTNSSNMPGADWGFVDLGRDRVATHCGTQAFDLDLGEWECARCDAVVHVRTIPGWSTPRQG